MKVMCGALKLVSLEELIPNPRNPNKHPQAQLTLLAKVMRFQGVRNPIVVSKLSGFIIKGHARLESAKLNGWTHFPVDYQSYDSEAQEYADMVADNKIQELSSNNMDMIFEDVQKFRTELPDPEVLGVPNFTFDIPKKLSEDPDIEFSKEVDEKNDYLVLLFDSKEAFKKACEKLGVKSVKYHLSPTKHESFCHRGIGRIVMGKDVIDRL